MPGSLVLNGNGCGMALGICPRQSRRDKKRGRMTQIGRNTPCSCGSEKTYKRGWEPKEADRRQHELPPGRFRYETGSDGGAGRDIGPPSFGQSALKPTNAARRDERSNGSRLASVSIADAGLRG